MVAGEAASVEGGGGVAAAGPEVRAVSIWKQERMRTAWRRARKLALRRATRWEEVRLWRARLEEVA